MDAPYIDRINALYYRLKALVIGLAEITIIRSHAGDVPGGERHSPGIRERTPGNIPVDYSVIRPYMFNK